MHVEDDPADGPVPHDQDGEDRVLDAEGHHAEPHDDASRDEDSEDPEEAGWDEGTEDPDDTGALIPCPHCGLDIHEESQRCEHCGDYVTADAPSHRRPWWFVIGGVLALYAAYRWIFMGS